MRKLHSSILFLPFLLIAGISTRAQTIATAEAATSVTILPADPAMRPVPETGIGVSYTGVPFVSRRALAFERHCNSEIGVGASTITLDGQFSPAAVLASGAPIEGIQLRSPQGQRYSAHIVRPLRARPLTGAMDYQAPLQKQIVVSLE